MHHPPSHPSFIGPYRVLERLGEGGSGDVYLCEQLQPIRRRVAVKILRTGMDSARVLARFRREPQLLALLEHPDIARVFDAGETEQGLPYFAMEYIAGRPLAAYCNERELGVRERVALMIAVCNAVHHAHQKGIIHQDLKPANVLVTDVDDKAQPKIIDFGVARAMLDGVAHDGAAVLIASPQYMSPEQAHLQSTAVDTRSDIYSLGAMLYELLAGRTPLVPLDKVLPLSELRRILESQTPPPPSAIHAMENGVVSPLRAREVRGELDWITLKALEHDPARRYETAADLAADLRRHLEHQPVHAARPGRGYALRKLVRRHSLASVLVSLIVATLLAFTGYSGWQAQLLRQERDRMQHEALNAKESTELLVVLFSLGDPQSGNGNVTVRSALDFGEKHIESKLAQQPRVRADLLYSMARVYNSIGLPDDAERVLVKMLNETDLPRLSRDEAQRELTRARLAQTNR